MQGEPYDLAVECLDRVISKTKPDSSSKMRSAVVALFSSDYDNRLRYSTQICLLHLDYDRHLKASFLRFYHLETLALLLQVELYYGFLESYRVKDQALNLWGFDLWRMGTICIQFRNELEAQIFLKKLEQCAPKREALLELSRKQVEEELRKRKENSFFGKIKNIFKKPDPEKKESVVLEVVKSNSVCIDKQGNFHTQHISPEWEEILRRSGLKPSDLKDKAIAQLVLEETIIFEAKKAAEADPNILAPAGIACIRDLDEQQEKEQKHEELTGKTNRYSVRVENGKEEEESDKVNGLPNLPPLLPSLDLPQPPPIDFLLPLPPLDLPPPLPAPTNRISFRRENLLEEIRNNNIKLKPVKTNGEKIQIDASSLNKEERIDLSQQIRKRLQLRKAALNRHQGDEDD